MTDGDEQHGLWRCYVRFRWQAAWRRIGNGEVKKLYFFGITREGFSSSRDKCPKHKERVYESRLIAAQT